MVEAHRIVPPKQIDSVMRQKAETVLRNMTLEEKIGQLWQAPFFSGVITGHAFDSTDTVTNIKAGKVGSILSVYDQNTLLKLQRTAVEESRLGIPLLFCFDVIHGFRTAFPTNLAMSCSWDSELIETVSSAVAYEMSHGGIHLTFSPMVDLVRDPRWGRVMESNGEDPYLSSVLAAAYIRGYQQDDLTNPHAVATCVKHFAAYGAVEAGREYNTVDISERALRNNYLPPFKAAVDAGSTMVMTAFNTLFDIPCTANKKLLKTILRDEMGFDGVTISDYTSTEEIIHHKVAEDEREAAYKCFTAGLDHEMVAKTYMTHMADLVKAGDISEKAVDEAVLRMLMLKHRLGLFDHPYRNINLEGEKHMLLEKTRRLALEAAEKSIILLKNESLLPLTTKDEIILCGPYADSQDVNGAWPALTRQEETTSLTEAMANQANVTFATFDKSNETILKQFSKAGKIVLVLGEPSAESGEGNSKTSIHLSDDQKTLFDEIRAVNEHIILVVFAGRPLIMTHYDHYAKAIVYAWQLGTASGHALRNILFGDTVPSAKTTITFPRHEGQIPIYYNHYNTGRPFDPARPTYRYNSRYNDCSNDPLYPFGHGLSYTTFNYSDLATDKSVLNADEILNITVTLTNTGQVTAEEIVQCYIEATNFSVARPLNELKSYRKIRLVPGEKQTVTFNLSIDDFRAYNINMAFTAENHDYKIKVGPVVTDCLTTIVRVNDTH